MTLTELDIHAGAPRSQFHLILLGPAANASPFFRVAFEWWSDDKWSMINPMGDPLRPDGIKRGAVGAAHRGGLGRSAFPRARPVFAASAAGCAKACGKRYWRRWRGTWKTKTILIFPGMLYRRHLRGSETGASQWERPSGARVRSSWLLPTLRVFHSPCTRLLLLHMKSPLSKLPSLKPSPWDDPGDLLGIVPTTAIRSISGLLHKALN